MYFKKKNSVIFRGYRGFGYIIDGSVFGYKKIGDDDIYLGDKVLSESGAAFFSALDRKPQSIDDIVKKICIRYTDSDASVIKSDAIEFYSILERNGFVLSGSSFQECDGKDKRFSYKTSAPSIIMLNSPDSTVGSVEDTFDFFENKFNGAPRLTSIHIEITSKCNERCIHCYIPHQNKILSVDPSLFFNILHQCNDMGVLHLTLSGGEPMLHKCFGEFLRKSREYDFAVSVLTNLTLLNDELVKEMKESDLFGVQTLLYSMNPSIHDGITKMNGSFEKTKSAIIKLYENDIPLQISCPIMKQNKRCYKEVEEWAMSYGINVRSEYIIIGSYGGLSQNTNCRLSIDEVQDVILDKADSDITYFERMREKISEKGNKRPNDRVCSVCDTSICIAENGDVYPCSAWQSFIVGNVKEQPLERIWNYSEKVQYLRGLRQKDFSKCIICADKDFCTMCMVRNANEHPLRDPLVVSEYFCRIAGINKKILLNHLDQPDNR